MIFQIITGNKLSGVFMKVKFISVFLMAVTINANAAFYFKTNYGNKVTVSKDYQSAVYVSGDGQATRYKFDFAEDERIDNQGRPYRATSYMNEACSTDSDCKFPALGIKTYLDKNGGGIILFQKSDGEVIQVEEVKDADITADK